MKKLLGLLTLAVFFIGCNMNPNKETRIQKLETEIQHAMEQISQLEKRVESLEDVNKQLEIKIEAMGRED